MLQKLCTKKGDIWMAGSRRVKGDTKKPGVPKTLETGEGKHIKVGQIEGLGFLKMKEWDPVRVGQG